MKKYLFTGVAINQLSLISKILFRVIILKLLLSAVGLNLYGLMQLFTDWIAYLSLGEMGLGTVTMQALYKPLAENNTAKVKNILITCDRMYKKIILGILAALLISLIFLPYLINKNQFNSDFYYYWILIALPLPLSYTYAKYALLYTADKKYNLIRFAQTCVEIIVSITTILALYYTQSIYAYIFPAYLSCLLNFLASKYIYRKYYRGVSFKRDEHFIEEKQILKKLRYTLIHGIGVAVLLNTDSIIITNFISLAAAGLYANYIFVYSGAKGVANSLHNAVEPYVGNYIAQNDLKTAYLHYRKINIIFLFIACIGGFCMFFLGNSFITLWQGKQYLLSESVLFLFAVNLTISIYRTTLEIFKSQCGYFADYPLTIVEVIINLGVSIILVQKYMILGVIIGTFTSFFIVLLFGKPYILYKRCFELSGWRGIAEYWGNIILAILAFPLAYLLVQRIYWVPDSWLSWLALTLAVIVCTVGSLLIVFVWHPDFRAGLRLFRREKV